MRVEWVLVLGVACHPVLVGVLASRLDAAVVKNEMGFTAACVNVTLIGIVTSRVHVTLIGIVASLLIRVGPYLRVMRSSSSCKVHDDVLLQLINYLLASLESFPPLVLARCIRSH